MKKLLKTYKVFNSGLYSLLMLLVLPVLDILFDLLIVPEAGVEIAIVINSGIILIVGLMGDYVVFNGTVGKNIPLRLMRSSLKGSGVLRCGLILDELRRFVQIYILNLVCVLIERKGFNGITSMDMFYVTFATLVIFATGSLILNGLRYVSVFSLYALICGISELIPVVLISAVIYFVELNTFTMIGYLAGAAIAAVIFGVVLVEHSMVSYDKSFGRRLYV